MTLFEISEPGLLTFGKLPGSHLNESNQVFDGGFGWHRISTRDAGVGANRLQPVDHFLIAQRLTGSLAERMGWSGQPSHFVDQPFGKHLADTVVDSLVQPVPRRRQPVDLPRTNSQRQWPLTLKIRKRLPQQLKDFEGSNDPALVVRMKAGSRFRIDLTQSIMQEPGAVFSTEGLKS